LESTVTIDIKIFPDSFYLFTIYKWCTLFLVLNISYKQDSYKAHLCVQNSNQFATKYAELHFNE